MIKLMPAESGNFHNFKCGEVYCLSTQRYDISCNLCGAKVELIKFPKHFQEQHLSCETLKDGEEESARSPIASRTRRKQLKESDPLFPSEELVTVKPEDIDEEEVSAFSWNDHFEADELPMETPVVENEPVIEEKVKNKSDESDHRTQIDIGEIGAKTDTFCGLEDDEIDIGIENHEWLHEKYSYEDVPSEEDDSADLAVLGMTTIKENFYDSEEESDYKMEDFNNFAKKKQEGIVPEDFVDETLPCEHCKRIFNSQFGLKMHIKAAHERATFTAQRSKNPKSKPPLEFSCEDCGEKFVTERNLVTHRYKHTGIFCDICGKQFSQIGNMERHRIRHTGIKTIKCEECDMTFFTERELKAHMMKHTGILPIICEICGKRCRDHGVLTAHMRRHTGERPAKCNVCGKSFFCGYDLNVHSVTHTTERPFKCDICGSTFQLKKSLRVHKKIHSKERNHVCKVCGKGFAQSSGLQSHMRLHEGATVLGSSKFFETGDSVDDVTDVAVEASNAAIADVAVAQETQWGLGLIKF